MKWEDEIDGLLQEAAREHRSMEPPARLEGALLARMEERTARPARRGVIRKRVWAFAGAAALVALSVWGGFAWHRMGGWEKKGQDSAKTVQREIPAQVQKPDEHAAVERRAKPADRRVAKPAMQRRAERGAAGTEETGSLDMFVPLPVSEGLAPANRLSLVRVQMLGGDLQQYGLEAPPEAAARSVLAEFVVGEDGLPRAIRIVQQ